MMTKNNIIFYGWYDRDEKVGPYTCKIIKQFISARKKMIIYE